MDGVISVFHSHPTRSGLHTTRSWEFIRSLEADGDRSRTDGDGDEEVSRKASYGKNFIVGVLDTGKYILPSSQFISLIFLFICPLIKNGKLIHTH